MLNMREVLLLVLATVCVDAKNSHLNQTVFLKDCGISDLRLIRESNPQPLEISLSNCQMDDLPNAVFLRFPNLKVLDMPESELMTIQDYALNGLIHLEILNLPRNNLTAVKSWSDHDLEYLYSLDLRRNSIKELHKFAFKHYPNLLKINLAVNLIEDLPENLFKFTPNLKYLNLGKNYLKTIDAHSFKHLHKLTHLAVHQNMIELMDHSSFVGVTHLKLLHLQDNKINVFEGALLSNLPRLTFLNLSHNQIEKLDDDTFEKNLELKTLDISYNLLKELGDDTLDGLEVLETFNASNNFLEKIHRRMFQDFGNVKVFDLSVNNISEIPERLFESIQEVERLNFSSNSITEIDTFAMQGLKKLVNIDLSHNELDSDKFLWPVFGLKVLNITHNNFKTINTSVLQDLMEAKLWSNPWECRWLVEEMLFSSNIKFGRDYVIEYKDKALSVPGIQCFEDNGVERSVIVLKIDREVEEASFNKNIRRIHQQMVDKDYENPVDEFNYRSALLWLSMGFIIVFGAMKILHCLLRKSEQQSEEWRLNQHVSYNSQRRRRRKRPVTEIQLNSLTDTSNNYDTITSSVFRFPSINTKLSN